jgi:hypothetical protein
MKPAWDQLADEFAASSSVVIADVDCTDGGKELCESLGVGGCKLDVARCTEQCVLMIESF